MDRDPDKWFIGWEWHAGMWYVDPPVGIELDDEAWFTDRAKAFAFVDEQLQKQPVQNSLVDEVPEQPFELTRIKHEDNPLLPPSNGVPRYVPKALRSLPVAPEPNDEVTEKSAARVADYASRVGLG